ncbi:hypothetical protein AA15973_0812 [Komagataeibacter sucrofermentans DSM 15973]|nr:hypothetical protein AA15973_0812 [Komagataeibacter sucrofermentans DSM 15973]
MGIGRLPHFKPGGKGQHQNGQPAKVVAIDGGNAKALHGRMHNGQDDAKQDGQDNNRYCPPKQSPQPPREKNKETSIKNKGRNV